MATEGEPGLVRRLGMVDTALITVGATLGSAVFLTTGDMARAVPSAPIVLALWAVGGVLTLAGALTYAELGAMFPKAGGQYQYLKEAYGPMPAFLFGWASFLVTQTGGIASLAVGFGEYLGSFVPFLSTSHILFHVTLAGRTFGASGGQLAGAATLVVLSAINCFGVKQGAFLQNVVTALKMGALVALVGAGIFLGGRSPADDATQTLAPAHLLSGVGVAMIAVFWSYDGWYCATFSAGEVRRPEKNLPRGLIAGVLALTLLYLLVNVVYVRVLGVGGLTASTRVGEDAARALFGAAGGRIVSAAVLVSIFGCIASGILTTSRIYLPMAQDGVFFARLARVHPRWHTPVGCIVAQCAWSVLLVFSGTYQQLYTYVVVAGLLFHAATGVALFVLRRRLPDAPRPYRAWGYPWVPLVFVATSLAVVASALVERPVESLAGAALVVLGLPFYAYWTRRRRAPA